MLLTLFRFFYGYVVFGGVCNYPSKFMNLMAQNGIKIWNIKCKDCYITAHIRCSNYKFIRTVAKQTGMHVKIAEKHGFPFILKKYKHKGGLLVGAILFVISVFILSFFVWKIEIFDTTESKSEIENLLNDVDIKIGTPVNSIDANLLEQTIMDKVKNISWCAVNIQGSVIQIETKHAEEPPEIVNKNGITNLVATKDAQVTRNEVYSGKVLVGYGDVVLRGQVLVSGEVTDETGGVTFERSTGKVYALARRNLEVQVPMIQEKKTYLREPTIRKKLKIGPWSIPLTLNQIPEEPCELIIDEHRAKIFNIDLPINMYSEAFFPISKESEQIDINKAQEQAQLHMAKKESEELGEVKIKSKDEKYEVKNNTYILTTSYLCEENIAIEVPFETQPENIAAKPN